LADEHKDEPRYRRLTAQIATNVGNALRDLDRAADALPLYDQALATLRRTPGEESRPVEARLYVGRAQTRTKLKRHAEAAADWDRARRLERDVNQVRWRVQAALSRGRAGDVAGAEAAELEELLDADQFEVPPPAGAYEMACLWALAAGASKGEAAERGVKRAMKFLERARDGRLFDGAAHRKNLEADDPDLAALRGRPEFKAFVAGLGKPQE
ncbi:MAG: tetratricopeptide repeat protein, partial [Gemmataceae bacterium]